MHCTAWQDLGGIRTEASVPWGASPSVLGQELPFEHLTLAFASLCTS